MRRGQSLVVLALTMLLLVVAVCLTLAIGTKAKEKIELQTQADQAAWSGAVATARTFNQLAIVNRANVAHYVAMLGVQSTLSFTASYIGYLDNVFAWYGVELLDSPCGLFSPSCCVKPIIMPFNRILPLYAEIRRANSVLNAMDQRVALQAQRPLSAAGALFGLQLTDLIANNLYRDKIQGQQLARRVVAQSRGSASDIVVPGVDRVARREIGLSVWPPVQGALAPAIASFDFHIGNMVMASRSHPWISNRSNSTPVPMVDLSGGYSLLLRQLRRFLRGDSFNALHMGSAHVGDDWHPSSLVPTDASLRQGIADDHAVGLLRYTGTCPSGISYPVAAAGMVRGSSGLSEHKGGLGGSIAGGPTYVLPVPLLGYGSDARHQLTMPATPFPPFVDYNPTAVNDAADADGQPKVPVVLVRDANRLASPDPWNLMSRFRVSAGARIDLHGDSTHRLTYVDGTDASKMVALASGLVYYHRAGHWAEPPNLFNPFWRAGLTRGDVDAQSVNDVPDTLAEAGAPAMGDTYRRLRDRGFVAAP